MMLDVDSQFPGVRPGAVARRAAATGTAGRHRLPGERRDRDAAAGTGAAARIALGLGAPAATILLLPAPGRLLAGFRAGGVADTLGATTLLAASGIAWALAGWAALVIVGIGAARLPGTTGRIARGALRRITPPAARRLVLVAAGISLTAAAAACGTDHGAVTATPTTVARVATVLRPMTTVAEPPPIVTSPDARADGSDSVLPELGWPVDPPARQPVEAQPPADTQPPVEAPQPAHAPQPRDAAPMSAPSTGAPEAGAPQVPATTESSRAAGPTGGAPRAADPARPGVGPATSTPIPATSGADARRAAVIVRPGDTLWAIARAHLPVGSTPTTIDATWRSWYAANRTVIGPDPNLLLPGRHLRPPA